jgi:carboxysome peptide B
MMEIMQVAGSLVCTQRVDGLGHMHLRILRNNKGKRLVAVDPVGASPGNWVFTASGSAARYACPDPTTLTDLTIGGIIDHWSPDG